MKHRALKSSRYVGNIFKLHCGCVAKILPIVVSHLRGIESDFDVAHQDSFLISVILPRIEIAPLSIDPHFSIILSLSRPLFLLLSSFLWIGSAFSSCSRPCGNARQTRKDLPGKPKTSIFGLPSANQSADCSSRSRSSLMQRNSSERRH